MTASDTIITLELGHYRLRERIGGSAYGVIWRAEGPRGTRDVALKLINEAQMARALPAQRERWIASAETEIAFLQLLEPWDERHIVRLLDSGWHNGLPVLALELLDCDLGRHMKTLCGRGAALQPERLLAWMAQLNQALAKVHQYGWRYLDLKPGNVLVDAQLGTVKLADFGTNRRLDALGDHTYTGTANWQAPEQFFPRDGGGYATGRQSDYFALGALFYFMATGAQLRYCGACGHAYREHRTAGASLLLRQHGGLPAILQQDEEALFAQAFAGTDGAAEDRPAGSAAADAALRLLRHLLAAEPQARPRHAIDISRQLALIGVTGSRTPAGPAPHAAYANWTPRAPAALSPAQAGHWWGKAAGRGHAHVHANWHSDAEA
ncbi:serine/threonine-protein kinase [Massilia sp. Root351]|uniref:serine/threonine-protein kinase n=1 Tax=Massilia sp. Root351 TaxID=1736522 RepID=UPI0009EA0271|nr:serine/threonine-protein kinase [Massilia sp. Root351]